MHSWNWKVNAFETTMGLFLHSCRTPKKVIDILAHLRISISVNSIHNAVGSLSAESADHIWALGQSLLIAWAYDNFDVDLKSSVPTIQNSGATLHHLTLAILYPLQHDVQPDDLKCSEELWKRSQLNPYANPLDVHLRYSWKDLMAKITEVHPDTIQVIDRIQLNRQARFYAWKFLYDLWHHGPAYFAQFSSALSDPEAVDQIPLIKTPIIPACSMEFSNSTVAGNISTITDLMRQGGVGDPDDLDTIYKVKDGMLYMFFFSWRSWDRQPHSLNSAALFHWKITMEPFSICSICPWPFSCQDDLCWFPMASPNWPQEPHHIFLAPEEDWGANAFVWPGWIACIKASSAP